MPEPDRLDTFEPTDTFGVQLEHAVHAFADRAQTHVDAAAVAQRVAGRRRTGAWALLGREVPVPVSMLLLIALLVVLLAWTVTGGGSFTRRADTAPLPVPLPAVPAPAPLQRTDGVAEDVVRGTETTIVVTEPTERMTEGRIERRNGMANVTTVTDDPRATGTGTWTFNSDEHATVSSDWGTYAIHNALGDWEGTCSGGSWNAGRAGVRSCVLTGTGAYAGYSYHFAMTQTGLGSGAVEGVIYPGLPPGP